MKKFFENQARKFTWNRAFWTTMGVAWILMLSTYVLPDGFALALVVPIIGLSAFSAFAAWMDHKEKTNRETDPDDHAQA